MWVKVNPSTSKNISKLSGLVLSIQDPAAASSPVTSPAKPHEQANAVAQVSTSKLQHSSQKARELPPLAYLSVREAADQNRNDGQLWYLNAAGHLTSKLTTVANLRGANEGEIEGLKSLQPVLQYISESKWTHLSDHRIKVCGGAESARNPRLSRLVSSLAARASNSHSNSHSHSSNGNTTPHSGTTTTAAASNTSTASSSSGGGSGGVRVLECHHLCCGVKDCESQYRSTPRAVALSPVKVEEVAQRWKLVWEFDYFMGGVAPILKQVNVQMQPQLPPPAPHTPDEHKSDPAVPPSAADRYLQLIGLGSNPSNPSNPANHAALGLGFGLGLDGDSEARTTKFDDALELVHTYMFEAVWSDKGTLAKKPVSVWRPQLPEGYVRFGDYAHAGHDMPVDKCLIAREHPAFQKPTGYSLVWSQKRSLAVGFGAGVAFYGWMPIPPDKDYIALGHIATTTMEPPSLSLARCVHRKFVRIAKDRLSTQIWSSEGAWGVIDTLTTLTTRTATPTERAARYATFWRVPEVGTLVISDSLQPPTGSYYRFRRSKMFRPGQVPPRKKGQANTDDVDADAAEGAAADDAERDVDNTTAEPHAAAGSDAMDVDDAAAHTVPKHASDSRRSSAHAHAKPVNTAANTALVQSHSHASPLLTAQVPKANRTTTTTTTTTTASSTSPLSLSSSAVHSAQSSPAKLRLPPTPTAANANAASAAANASSAASGGGSSSGAASHSHRHNQNKELVASVANAQALADAQTPAVTASATAPPPPLALPPSRASNKSSGAHPTTHPHPHPQQRTPSLSVVNALAPRSTSDSGGSGSTDDPGKNEPGGVTLGVGPHATATASSKRAASSDDDGEDSEELRQRHVHHQKQQRQQRLQNGEEPVRSKRHTHHSRRRTPPTGTASATATTNGNCTPSPSPSPSPSSNSNTNHNSNSNTTASASSASALAVDPSSPASASASSTPSSRTARRTHPHRHRRGSKSSSSTHPSDATTHTSARRSSTHKHSSDSDSDAGSRHKRERDRDRHSHSRSQSSSAASSRSHRRHTTSSTASSTSPQHQPLPSVAQTTPAAQTRSSASSSSSSSSSFSSSSSSSSSSSRSRKGSPRRHSSQSRSRHSPLRPDSVSVSVSSSNSHSSTSSSSSSSSLPARASSSPVKPRLSQAQGQGRGRVGEDSPTVGAQQSPSHGNNGGELVDISLDGSVSASASLPQLPASAAEDATPAPTLLPAASLPATPSTPVPALVVASEPSTPVTSPPATPRTASGIVSPTPKVSMMQRLKDLVVSGGSITGKTGRREPVVAAKSASARQLAAQTAIQAVSGSGNAGASTALSPPPTPRPVSTSSPVPASAGLSHHAPPSAHPSPQPSPPALPVSVLVPVRKDSPALEMNRSGSPPTPTVSAGASSRHANPHQHQPQRAEFLAAPEEIVRSRSGASMASTSSGVRTPSDEDTATGELSSPIPTSQTVNGFGLNHAPARRSSRGSRSHKADHMDLVADDTPTPTPTPSTRKAATNVHVHGSVSALFEQSDDDLGEGEGEEGGGGGADNSSDDELHPSSHSRLSSHPPREGGHTNTHSRVPPLPAKAQSAPAPAPTAAQSRLAPLSTPPPSASSSSSSSSSSAAPHMHAAHTPAVLSPHTPASARRMVLAPLQPQQPTPQSPHPHVPPSLSAAMGKRVQRTPKPQPQPPAAAAVAPSHGHTQSQSHTPGQGQHGPHGLTVQVTGEEEDKSAGSREEGEGYDGDTSSVGTVASAMHGDTAAGTWDRRSSRRAHEDNPPVNIDDKVSFSYHEVWTSRGSRAKRVASIWRPRLPDGYVMFGDYCHASFGQPTEGVGIAVDHPYFKRPIDYRLVWCFRSLWVWLPLPHADDYTALGCVVTRTASKPSIDCVRCVPLESLTTVNWGPQLWNDQQHTTAMTNVAGAVVSVMDTLSPIRLTDKHAGKEAAFWLVPGMKTFFVTAGSHAKPFGVLCYTFPPLESEIKHRLLELEMNSVKCMHDCVSHLLSLRAARRLQHSYAKVAALMCTIDLLLQYISSINFEGLQERMKAGVKAVSDKVSSLQEDVKQLVFADFGANVHSTVPETLERLKMACSVIDVLPKEVKLELIDRVCKEKVVTYGAIFDVKNPTNLRPRQLEASVARRVAWLMRTRDEFAEQFHEIFPLTWHVIEHFTYRWSLITREHTAEILKASEIDGGFQANDLVPSLRAFLRLERECEKNAKQHKFHGIVSDVFALHLGPYVAMELASITEFLAKLDHDQDLDHELEQAVKGAGEAVDRVLASSMAFFHRVNRGLARCAELSTGVALYNLFEGQKEGFTSYITLLDKKMDGIIGGEEKGSKSRGTTGAREVACMCILINTLHYIIDTLPNWRDSVLKMVADGGDTACAGGGSQGDAPSHAQANSDDWSVAVQVEGCSIVLAKAIKLLVEDVTFRVAPQLKAVAKTDFVALNTAGLGDVSPYMEEMVRILNWERVSCVTLAAGSAGVSLTGSLSGAYALHHHHHHHMSSSSSSNNLSAASGNASTSSSGVHDDNAMHISGSSSGGGSSHARSGLSAMPVRSLDELKATLWDKLDEAIKVEHVCDVVQYLVTPAYFRLFCTQLVSRLIKTYSACIYACSNIGELGAQQLLLDIHALKQQLLQLGPRFAYASSSWSASASTALEGGGGGVANPAVAKRLKRALNRTVAMELRRLQCVLNCAASPPGQGFAENFLRFFPKAKQAHLELVMLLKGMTKQEKNETLQHFLALLPPEESARLQALAHASTKRSFLTSLAAGVAAGVGAVGGGNTHKPAATTATTSASAAAASAPDAAATSVSMSTANATAAANAAAANAAAAQGAADIVDLHNGGGGKDNAFLVGEFSSKVKEKFKTFFSLSSKQQRKEKTSSFLSFGGRSEAAPLSTGVLPPELLNESSWSASSDSASPALMASASLSFVSPFSSPAPAPARSVRKSVHAAASASSAQSTPTTPLSPSSPVASSPPIGKSTTTGTGTGSGAVRLHAQRTTSSSSSRRDMHRPLDARAELLSK